MRQRRWVGVVLGVLALAFAFRVAGQAVVAFNLFELFGLSLPAGWPPMQAWSSGLIPYPALFALQLVILGIQAWHVRGTFRAGAERLITRDESNVERRHARLSRGLIVFAIVYATVMIVRYAIAITLRGGFGDPWWAGGLIPVCFHQVLAGYLMTWGITLWLNYRPCNPAVASRFRLVSRSPRRSR